MRHFCFPYPKMKLKIDLDQIFNFFENFPEAGVLPPLGVTAPFNNCRNREVEALGLEAKAVPFHWQLG